MEFFKEIYILSNFEKRFRKYAVPNLTLWLILGYAIGYIIQMTNDTFLYYLALDPYKILHGQIWRLITWIIIPPSSSSLLFVLLMLWCCYMIGNVLERTWGTYRYNLFILTGIVITAVMSFACLGFMYLTNPADMIEAYENGGYIFSGYLWYGFSTYYINVSIYIVFALTYPNDIVRLYFIIPIKMKWLAVIDLIYMGYILIFGGTVDRFAVVGALLNCLIFYLANIRGIALSPKQIHRKNQFNKSYKSGMNGSYQGHAFRESDPSKAPKMGHFQEKPRHKCCICGKTDITDPDMTFRYCSKCAGNYEYCQVHLFQHTHVKG